MFTVKAWLCFETLCRSQMPRQLVLKKMCQQTCHTHLRCQLPPEAESSPKTRDFRRCPAPTCLCQEPWRLGFILPSSPQLLASRPSPCRDQPWPCTTPGAALQQPPTHRPMPTSSELHFAWNSFPYPLPLGCTPTPPLQMQSPWLSGSSFSLIFLLFFNHQLLIESLLRARHCSGCW